jgi:hypothetical protein
VLDAYRIRHKTQVTKYQQEYETGDSTLAPSTTGTWKTGLTTESLYVGTGRNGYSRLKPILDYRPAKLQLSFVYAIEGMLLIDPMVLEHIRANVSAIASRADVDCVSDWKHGRTALQ